MARGFARDLSERFLGFYDVIHSVKAIRIARDTNHQKATRSPLPRRKGGRGDRSNFHGVIHSVKAIRIARDTNHQKAMRSPLPRRKGARGDRSMAVGLWG